MTRLLFPCLFETKHGLDLLRNKLQGEFNKKQYKLPSAFSYLGHGSVLSLLYVPEARQIQETATWRWRGGQGAR